jgi:hypothetical protein
MVLFEEQPVTMSIIVNVFQFISTALFICLTLISIPFNTAGMNVKTTNPTQKNSVR